MGGDGVYQAMELQRLAIYFDSDEAAWQPGRLWREVELQGWSKVGQGGLGQGLRVTVHDLGCQGRSRVGFRVSVRRFWLTVFFGVFGIFGFLERGTDFWCRV